MSSLRPQVTPVSGLPCPLIAALLGIMYEDKERQDFIFTIYHWWQAVAIFAVYLGSSLPMKVRLGGVRSSMPHPQATYLLGLLASHPPKGSSRWPRTPSPSPLCGPELNTPITAPRPASLSLPTLEGNHSLLFPLCVHSSLLMGCSVTSLSSAGPLEAQGLSCFMACRGADFSVGAGHGTQDLTHARQAFSTVLLSLSRSV